MTFKDLGIIEPILKALNDAGYTNPTPIQEQAIPILLNREDLLGCAQTGTGKTAAFTIPIIQHLYNSKQDQKGRRKIKALIITPTRELAIQINDNITAYGRFTGLRNTVIFGGVKQGSQTNELKRGTDILVATPGRLLDLISQGFITLKDIKYFVLDEADQMLDMGFIHDIKKVIAKLPFKRQSLFFSATMPVSIVKLSSSILGNYKKVTIKPKQATAEKVDQAIYFVSKPNKLKLLTHILEANENSSVLVFSRTKHGSDKIVRQLGKAGIKSAAIHGNKSQNARQRALKSFKKGELNVLIATDIAARGIDVSDLSLVINYDLPNIPETYVHRIGRTGRAEASGIALSFCNTEEKEYLKDIQKLINQQIPVIEEHPFPLDENEEVVVAPKQTKNQRKKSARRKNSNQKPKESGAASANKPKKRRYYSGRRK
ncbi:ATP-dependent RNA helicase RhlE [Lutibacter oricola]|uniref:ATP-dependent RNA helicase RhlE n=1 Tax=Lutibacter oricola TaxID=762486 RepID=A0A1H2RIZ7_9FLAO|nr:DEAD/DEAH box helicase [Lutibacter oricola]SDW18609.1 ATP-dependent RNA helicase RhlE [Lutibacter oricola]